MLAELLERINVVRTNNECLVVGMSGFAGSGKSTLASKLAAQLAINDSQIVRIDNLYSAEPRGKELFDEYDWGKLAQIIQDYRAGKDISFLSRSFDDIEKPINMQKPEVLLIEGIKLFRQELMYFFDFSVWIDCPIDFAINRAKARDLKQGHDDEYMKRWDSEWKPQSQEYFDTYKPNLLANFLYRDYQ